MHFSYMNWMCPAPTGAGGGGAYLAGGGVAYNRLIRRGQVCGVQRSWAVDWNAVDGTERRVGEVQL